MTRLRIIQDGIQEVLYMLNKGLQSINQDTESVVNPIAKLNICGGIDLLEKISKDCESTASLVINCRECCDECLEIIYIYAEKCPVCNRANVQLLINDDPISLYNNKVHSIECAFCRTTFIRDGAIEGWGESSQWIIS